MFHKARHILRQLSLSILLLLAATTAAAGGKLSSAMQLWLLQHSQLHAPAQQQASVQVFVAGGDGIDDVVQRVGGTVQSSFHGFVTAQVPICAIGQLASSSRVSQIDISRSVHLLCDSDRSLTHVNQVLSGTGLPRAFNGSGVVLGIVDSGFDFNHPAFRRSDGSTRISHVYLSGTLYDSTQVSSLTTDTRSTSHGTHVMGIAGGTLCGNYGGMAPGAELFVAALPDTSLTEVNIVNACYLMARYAQGQGKPCVINLSLGNHDGPHDGTGFMARAFDDICTHIGHTAIVLASGNEGGSQLYVHKKLNDGQPLRTILSAYSSNIATQVNVWNQDTTKLTFTLGVMKRSTRDVIYQSTALSADTIISSAADDALAQLLTGTVAFTWGRNVVTGKTDVLCDINATMKSSNYQLCFTVDGDRNADVHMWECNGLANFTSNGQDGYLAGSDSCSISDMATGTTTISVGSYVGRTQHRTLSGTTVQDSSYPVGTRSTFSSWGTDLRGVQHPIVTAPGQAVISSLNSYLTVRTPVQQQVLDGTTYSWGSMTGTSMSSPCAAGILALWLQANSKLTGEQLRQLASSTSTNGKIDALAGITQALSLGVNDVKQSDLALHYAAGMITASIPCQLQVYSITGQMQLSHSGRSISVENLTPGIYLAKASSPHGVTTLKFVKR